MNKNENIALFDMDGTLCDYETGLRRELEKMRAPEEKPFIYSHDAWPDHIKARADAIRAQESWWANLPKLQQGCDVLGIAQELRYKVMILTQGPRTNPVAWAGKVRWINEHFPETEITITRDKGLVYGKVLVDDYPPYIERWLQWRKRGAVIMPQNEHNKEYKHRQVHPYDGSLKSLSHVRKILEERLE